MFYNELYIFLRQICKPTENYHQLEESKRIQCLKVKAVKALQAIYDVRFCGFILVP